VGQAAVVGPPAGTSAGDLTYTGFFNDESASASSRGSERSKPARSWASAAPEMRTGRDQQGRRRAAAAAPTWSDPAPEPLVPLSPSIFSVTASLQGAL
jgi:hypothetical protein